jgi:hypothetical protein
MLYHRKHDSGIDANRSKNGDHKLSARPDIEQFPGA